MEHKNIKLESGGEKYDIEYKRTQSVLYFNDKNGASIGFVKDKGRLSVFVNSLAMLIISFGLFLKLRLKFLFR